MRSTTFLTTLIITLVLLALSACDSAPAVQGAPQQRAAGAIEIAKFRVRAGRAGELQKGHAAAMAAIRRACPGLQDVKLVHFGGDVWADVATWDRKEDAQACLQKALSVPEFTAWSSANIAAEVSCEMATIPHARHAIEALR